MARWESLQKRAVFVDGSKTVPHLNLRCTLLNGPLLTPKQTDPTIGQIQFTRKASERAFSEVDCLPSILAAALQRLCYDEHLTLPTLRLKA